MTGAPVFEAAFRRAERGRPATFSVLGGDGRVHAFEPAVWSRDDLPGDADLLAGCAAPRPGPTLDVGCGPGRLAGALSAAGHPALGIDISAAAVRLARGRGATVLHRDVFGAVPGTGRWAHVLLADGNIGIGGDPGRLLSRCRELLAPDGRLHAELAAPGRPLWSGTTTVHTGSELLGATLPWAQVPVDAIELLAAPAGLRVTGTRAASGRWFATLTPR